MVQFKKIRITLAQLFGIGLALLIVLLGLLFYFLSQTSESSVIQTSEQLRRNASRELAGKVTQFLMQAQNVQNNFQAEVTHAVFNPKDPIALETFLFTEILTNPSLSEISLIFGEKISYDSEGRIRLALEGRGEMSLYRSASGIDTRYTIQKNGMWISKLRLRSPQDTLFGTPWKEHQTLPITDPTMHLTFLTPASKAFANQSIWSDLHWSEIDNNLLELSVQKTVTDANGNFLGVLRVGLFEKNIEMIAQLKLMTDGAHDPHLIFITDSSGELITRLNNKDPLKLIDGNLRYSAEHAPQEVQESLRNPILKTVTDENPLQSGTIKYLGKTYLVTFRKINMSQDWILGIIVPESYYVGPLQATRNRLLITTSLIIFFLCIGGLLLQRILKKEQQKIVQETTKMQHFDFSPELPYSPFQDIYAILTSLEQAKTAMRAMSKYVPVDLVKLLYQSQKEPILGGKNEEITILFTDIYNFTTAAEQLPANELANALGNYLQVMTSVIQNIGHGMIDKYVGDGIMALWNTPNPLPQHAKYACLAVLECKLALKNLFASKEWKHLPRFETRFGLHKDNVTVGHFGAPDRLNFTAIGNGVNVASRLESLNKHYGTSILVTEPIVEAAKEDFEFRFIDFIVVKGKTKGLKVYELLGKKGKTPEMSKIISSYEHAFQEYQNRHFSQAIDLLKDQLTDGPSLTLHTRCCHFLKHPPPDEWDGTYVLNIK